MKFFDLILFYYFPGVDVMDNRGSKAQFFGKIC
jgi:hypothetical protein